MRQLEKECESKGQMLAHAAEVRARARVRVRVRVRVRDRVRLALTAYPNPNQVCGARPGSLASAYLRDTLLVVYGDNGQASCTS